MAKLSTWSTTAALNNSASPDGMPENMAPSGVNNSHREAVARIREFYSNIEWREFAATAASGGGTGDEHTLTWVSGTVFTTPNAEGDLTGTYTVGRRIRAEGTSTTTIYGVIDTSVWTTVTTVTVVWDSGSMSNDANLTISLGPNVTGKPIAGTSIGGDVAAEDLTVSGTAAFTGITTEGDLAIVSSGGVFEQLALGSLDQYPASNGTTAVYSSGAWRFIDSYVPASDALIEFFHDGIDSDGSASFVDGYSYRIEFEDIQGSVGGQGILLQLYEGAAYRSSSALYVRHVTGSVGIASADANDTEVPSLCWPDYGTSDTERTVSGWHEFRSLASTTYRSNGYGMGYGRSNSDNRSALVGFHTHSTSPRLAATKLKIYPESSGNLGTVGIFRLYRRKDA